MTSVDELKQQQQAFWNGPRGEVWSRRRAFMDAMLQPFEDRLVDEVRRLSPADGPVHVLDVGCGAGATTLALKRALSDEASCLGVDISGPLLDTARARADKSGLNVRFLCADAGAHDFRRGEFDILASRFGVMFFADPAAAFANLRRAASDDGRLAFVVWRSAEENDFMTAGHRAAAPHLPEPPPRDPHAPGPFSLGDPDRVRAILDAGGWGRVELAPLDLPCAFPAERLDLFVDELAPNAQDVAALEPGLGDTVRAAVRDAYGRYVQGGEVRFTARCWMIGAAASG